MDKAADSSSGAGVRSTGERIWGALVELHGQGQYGSRERLAQITGFTLSVIDDHISRWHDSGRVFRVKDGIYEPIVVSRSSRMIYVGRVPGSDIVKLELGGECFDVTQDEAREIGRQFAGYALEYNQITIKQDVGAALTAVVELTAENKRTQEHVRQLERKLALAHEAMCGLQPDMFVSAAPV